MMVQIHCEYNLIPVNISTYLLTTRNSSYSRINRTVSFITVQFKSHNVFGN